MIFLVGLALFALWIVLVFVSFFAFFVPPLQGIFSVALGVLLGSIVLMVVGGLTMLTGVSGGWTWGGEAGGGPRAGGGGWFGRVAARRAFKDRLRVGERFGELFGVVVSFLIGLYFVESQLQGTGFFTTEFKGPEEVFFYGPWVVGMAIGVGRALYGRRNSIRPFDAAQSFFVVVAAFWLLSAFPFNFAHLPDLLPQAVRFMFSWVNDQVGEVVLVLAGIGSLASMAYTSVLYVAVRSQIRHGVGGGSEGVPPKMA